MSTSAAPRESSVNEPRSQAPVIDLTDEDGTEESQGSEGQSTVVAEDGSGVAGSSRASRLPRFGRDVIDLESSGEEEEEDNSHLPGSNYLALPPRRSRPHLSSLRRPARLPSPPRNMDDIEFLESRPRSRPLSTSRQPTPALDLRRGPRSATPYPTHLHEPIDLTEDNDDDVVHLNTRTREGVNAEAPGATAGMGTRGYAGQGFAGVGHAINMLRNQGVDFGGRLMQRLQGMAGLEGEIRAQEQAMEHHHYNHTHHHQHAHRHHHNHRPHADVRLGMGGHRVQVEGRALPRPIGNMQMPGQMNYGMTGFDMDMGGNRPPTPKYSPPPEPEKGFTRSPGEDEVVVCPNCGDELATGDSDLKHEVHVIKTCGHVSALETRIFTKARLTFCRYTAASVLGTAPNSRPKRAKVGLHLPTQVSLRLSRSAWWMGVASRRRGLR